MNVSHSITDKIVAYAKRNHDTPLRYDDIASFGTRSAVDQALSRLVRDGRLRRIRRGIYEFPRQSPVLKLPVTVPADKVMQAWALKNGVRLIPAGAWAANLLRLSTQVPVKMEYCTNGPTRRVMVDGTSVQLKHRGPRTMNVYGVMSAAVMEALRYLGKDRVGEPEILRLKSLLSPSDKAQLVRNMSLAPAWMRPILEAVAMEDSRHG